MHVATAIRYGADALITNDEKDLLRRASEIRARFNDFPIMRPSEALAFVNRLLNRYRVRTGDESAGAGRPVQGGPAAR